MRLFGLAVLAATVGCSPYDIRTPGTVAVGGWAPVYGQRSDGACSNLWGCPTTVLPVVDVENLSPGLARLDEVDGELRIYPEREGTVHLTGVIVDDGVEHSIWDWVELAEPVRIEAWDYAWEPLSEATIDPVHTPGFTFYTNLVDAEGESLTGNGLHGVSDTEGLLTIESSEWGEHLLTSSGRRGLTEVIADWDGSVLFSVEVLP